MICGSSSTIGRKYSNSIPTPSDSCSPGDLANAPDEARSVGGGVVSVMPGGGVRLGGALIDSPATLVNDSRPSTPRVIMSALGTGGRTQHR